MPEDHHRADRPDRTPEPRQALPTSAPVPDRPPRGGGDQRACRGGAGYAAERERMTQREERIAAVKAAFLEGVRQYFPNGEHVELADDALIDLFEIGILDAPEEKFAEFLDGLRHCPPPEPVDEE